jgi:hypothetical protein
MSGQPPEGHLDRGKGNQGSQDFGGAFKVLDQTPVAAEPGESALDHLAARQDGELLHFVAPLGRDIADCRYRPSTADLTDWPPTGWSRDSDQQRRRRYRAPGLTIASKCSHYVLEG